MDALSDALVEMKPGEEWLEIETVFLEQYPRVARTIARVIRDPARAEELAVEVFLKYAKDRKARGEKAEPWLYRTAVRTGLNELRRQSRQSRYERLAALVRRSPRTPEELLAARQEQDRVRMVLSTLTPRDAELLVLRSQGLSYEELAAALRLNPASVGTLLSRAQRAFRKEHNERYGTE